MFEFTRKIDYLWFPLLWLLASASYPLCIALLSTNSALRDSQFLRILWLLLPIVYSFVQSYVLSFYRPAVILFFPLLFTISYIGLFIGGLFGYTFGIPAISISIAIAHGLGYAFMLFFDCGAISALLIFGLSCFGGWIIGLVDEPLSWLGVYFSPFTNQVFVAYPFIAQALFLALPLTLILFLSHEKPRI